MQNILNFKFMCKIYNFFKISTGCMFKIEISGCNLMFKPLKNIKTWNFLRKCLFKIFVLFLSKKNLDFFIKRLQQKASLRFKYSPQSTKHTHIPELHPTTYEQFSTLSQHECITASINNKKRPRHSRVEHKMSSQSSVI